MRWRRLDLRLFGLQHLSSLLRPTGFGFAFRHGPRPVDKLANIQITASAPCRDVQCAVSVEASSSTAASLGRVAAPLWHAIRTLDVTPLRMERLSDCRRSLKGLAASGVKRCLMYKSFFSTRSTNASNLRKVRPTEWTPSFGKNRRGAGPNWLSPT
jgi:hypothetical protein